MADKSARASASTSLRRAYPAQFEVRGKAGSTVSIHGYASVYDAPYEMWDMFGPYTEVMRGGSGKTTLSQDPAVQLLLNHEGLVMAATKPSAGAPTLRLAEDSTGLLVDADVDTRRTDASDMVLALERGDVNEMSFAFRCMRQEWSPDFEQRDILEYNINRGDVSVVNFGANPHTEVGLRAQDFDHLDETAARALYERLGRRLTPAEDPKLQGRALSLAAAELALLG